MRADNMVVLCILILGCVLSLSPLILFSDSERIDSVTRDDLSNEQITSLEEGPFAISIKDDNAIIVTSACLVNGSLIIAGEFSGSIEIAGIEYRSQGSSDILIERLHQNGTWVWVEILGGEGNDLDATIEYDEGHLILKGSIFGVIDSRNGGTVGSADNNGHQRIIAELSVESGSWEYIFVDQFGDLVSSSSLWCGWR